MSMDDDARGRALARLASSRERLSLQLIPPPAPPLCGTHAARGPLPSRLRALWRYWRVRAHGSPVASLALGAAKRWWAVQPWRPTAEWLGREVQQASAPLVRRHPLTAVALAAALAGALVWWRPWRSALVARQGRVLGRRAKGWLKGQLLQLPWQTLMAGAMALWAGRQSTDPAGKSSANPRGADPASCGSPGSPEPQADHSPAASASSPRNSATRD